MVYLIFYLKKVELDPHFHMWVYENECSFLAFRPVCADPEEGGPDPFTPEKSHIYRVSKQYWSGFPEKSQSYQASI